MTRRGKKESADKDREKINTLVKGTRNQKGRKKNDPIHPIERPSEGGTKEREHCHITFGHGADRRIEKRKLHQKKNDLLPDSRYRGGKTTLILPSLHNQPKKRKKKYRWEISSKSEGRTKKREPNLKLITKHKAKGF